MNEITPEMWSALWSTVATIFPLFIMVVGAFALFRLARLIEEYLCNVVEDHQSEKEFYEKHLESLCEEVEEQLEEDEEAVVEVDLPSGNPIFKRIRINKRMWKRDE